MKNKPCSPEAKIGPRQTHDILNGLDRPNPTSAPRLGTKRSTALSAVRPIPRRGLSREEAAMFVGVSASKFDELVRDGRMPGPKRIDGRKVWDVRQLDLAFDDLPVESNSWDDVQD